MTANPGSQKVAPSILKRISRLNFISRGLMLFEKSWPALWPGFSVIGFYISFSLFDPWKSVPPFIHIICLIITIGLSYYFFRKGLGQISKPSVSDANRRLEKPKHLKDRPLDFLEDEPIESTSPKAKALWQHHSEQVVEDIKKAKLSWPRAGLQYIDQIGLRMALLLMFVVGLFHAGSDWSRRLSDGFTISFSSRAPALTLNVWVTPPDYTNKTSISLVSLGQVNPEFDGQTIIIPEGSKLDINLAGASNLPDVSLNSRDIPFVAKSETSFSAEDVLYENDFLEIDLPFQPTMGWNIEVIPDTPPIINFLETPAPTPRNTIEVISSALDDYGVEIATFEVHQPGDMTHPKLRLPITLLPQDDGPTSQKSYFDLTASRWAGSLVVARLHAEDAIGGKGQSGELQFRLPEREFTHPVAKNIVSIRKSIFLNPENVEPSRTRLDLQSKNQDQFDHDLVVFSALRASFWRLNWAEQQEDFDTITDLLWDTALRLEDGAASLTEDQLRATMDALMEMLENGEDTQSMEELTNQMQQLLQEYLQNQGATEESIPQSDQNPPSDQQQMGDNAMMEMMKQIEELAAAGQTEEAMELMEELRSMMENMSPDQPSEEDYEKMMEGTESLNELDQMRQDQNDLMKETNREGQLKENEAEEGQRSEQIDDLKERQEQLNEKLQELMDKMEQNGFEEGEKLEPAKSSMEEAMKNLEQQNPEEAAQNQSTALDSMDQTLSELGQNLAEQMLEMQENAGNTDPLGRPISPDGEEEVLIPEQSSIQEAQRILQELRRRVADPTRPKAEIDYLRRLLKRFEQP